MIGRSCRLEREVHEAAASGRWTNALRHHAASCATCRDVALVSSALSGDATLAPRRVSPSILWAKARHARRRRAETMASRILSGGQIVSGVAGLAALAYFGARIDPWSVFTSSFGGGLPVPILLSGAGLLAVFGLATVRWLTRDS